MQDHKTPLPSVKHYHTTLEYPHQKRKLSRPSLLQQDQPERRNNSYRDRINLYCVWTDRVIILLLLQEWTGEAAE